MLKHLIKSKIASIWLVTRSPSYSIHLCTLIELKCNPKSESASESWMYFVCARRAIWCELWWECSMRNLQKIPRIESRCTAEKRAKHERKMKKRTHYSHFKEPFQKRFKAICTENERALDDFCIVCGSFDFCNGKMKFHPWSRQTIIDKIIVQHYCFTAGLLYKILVLLFLLL